jgi:hypothetical protein
LFFSSAWWSWGFYRRPIGHNGYGALTTHSLWDPPIIFHLKNFIGVYAGVGHIGIFVEKIAQLSASGKFWLVLNLFGSSRSCLCWWEDRSSYIFVWLRSLVIFWVRRSLIVVTRHARRYQGGGTAWERYYRLR